MHEKCPGRRIFIFKVKDILRHIINLSQAKTFEVRVKHQNELPI